MTQWVTVPQLQAVAAPDDGVTQDSSSYNDLSTTQLQTCCDQAQAEVAARLAVRFVLADNLMPSPLLQQITAAFAAYQAYLILQISADINPATDPVYLRYQWAMGIVNGVVNGTIVLPDQATGTPSTDGEVSVTNPAGVFFPPNLVGIGPLPWNNYGPMGSIGAYQYGANIYGL